MDATRGGGGPRDRVASLALRRPVVVQANPRPPRSALVILLRARKLPILATVSYLSMPRAPRSQCGHDQTATAVVTKA